MEEQSKTLDVLSTEVTEYLQKLTYSESRISQYRSAWQRVATFMKERECPSYSFAVGEAFIYHLMGDRSFDDLDRWEKDIIQCTNVLTEFLETGTVKVRRNQKFRELRGAVGQIMQEYIVYKKSYGISRETLSRYQAGLQHFLGYLDDCGITAVRALTPPTLILYANQLGFCTPSVRHQLLSVVKGFLRYLYDRELTEQDGSRMVPRDKYPRQPQLPSTYTPAEVEALIAAIDRSSPKGKRDYAMVLITARLGLRATDVCRLTFDHLHWEQSLIVLTQQKTKEPVTLPLLSEIGAALIDYLKFGRPASALPYIFLQVNAPYDRLNRSTLHSIVELYLRHAGIPYAQERRHGPHALRHSLAGVLLAKKIPVPVIAEVLGHRSTESTRFYLRIDAESLRQCALEVPPVAPTFYARRVPQ